MKIVRWTSWIAAIIGVATGVAIALPLRVENFFPELAVVIPEQRVEFLQKNRTFLEAQKILILPTSSGMIADETCAYNVQVLSKDAQWLNIVPNYWICAQIVAFGQEFARQDFVAKGKIAWINWGAPVNVAVLERLGIVQKDGQLFSQAKSTLPRYFPAMELSVLFVDL